MGDRSEEILKSSIVSGSIGNGEVHCDISEAKDAMDENGKRMCLELLDFMAKNLVVCGHWSSPDGFLFEYKGELISKEELFENFL